MYRYRYIFYSVYFTEPFSSSTNREMEKSRGQKCPMGNGNGWKGQPEARAIRSLPISQTAPDSPLSSAVILKTAFHGHWCWVSSYLNPRNKGLARCTAHPPLQGALCQACTAAHTAVVCIPHNVAGLCGAVIFIAPSQVQGGSLTPDTHACFLVYVHATCPLPEDSSCPFAFSSMLVLSGWFFFDLKHRFPWMKGPPVAPCCPCLLLEGEAEVTQLGKFCLSPTCPRCPAWMEFSLEAALWGQLVVSRDTPLLLTSGWRGATRAMLGAVLG